MKIFLTRPYLVELHRGNKISGVGVGVMVDDFVVVIVLEDDVGVTTSHST